MESQFLSVGDSRGMMLNPPHLIGAYVTSQSVLYSPLIHERPLSEDSRRDSLTFVYFFSEMYG